MAVARSSSGGVATSYVLSFLWMTSYLLISQGCLTSPPSWSAVHTQPWAWLGYKLRSNKSCRPTGARDYFSGASSNFPGGNTGGGVCGLWLPCWLLCAYVGEWSRRHWSSTENIHWRPPPSSLVSGQWRSRVGRRPAQSSHSAAEQWTTTTTRLHSHRFSSQAAVARTIMLRRTQISTLRCTRQPEVARHLAIQSTLTRRKLHTQRTVANT